MNLWSRGALTNTSSYIMCTTDEKNDKTLEEFATSCDTSHNFLILEASEYQSITCNGANVTYVIVKESGDKLRQIIGRTWRINSQQKYTHQFLQLVYVLYPFMEEDPSAITNCDKLSLDIIKSNDIIIAEVKNIANSNSLDCIHIRELAKTLPFLPKKPICGQETPGPDSPLFSPYDTDFYRTAAAAPSQAT
jgi:hypothetical protein